MLDAAFPALDAALPALDAAFPALDAALPVLDAAFPALDAALPALDAALPVLDAATPAHNAATQALDAALPAHNAVTPAPDAATPSHNAATQAHDTATPVLDAATPAHDAATPGHDAPTPAHDAPTPAHDAPTPPAHIGAPPAIARRSPASTGEHDSHVGPAAQRRLRSLRLLRRDVYSARRLHVISCARQISILHEPSLTTVDWMKSLLFMTARTRYPVVRREHPSSVSAVIVYGRHVILVMTNNAWFPSPPIALAVVSSDIDALENAEVATKGRAQGMVQIRNDKLKKVNSDLDLLEAYAQQIIDSHPDLAETIASSGGMHLRRLPTRNKPVLAAAMTGTPGNVRLDAKAVRRSGASYEWQYSPDDGKTWIAGGITTHANTTVTGLSPGATYLFRFRSTIGKTTSDWCPPISLIIH